LATRSWVMTDDERRVREHVAIMGLGF